VFQQPPRSPPVRPKPFLLGEGIPASRLCGGDGSLTAQGHRRDRPQTPRPTAGAPAGPPRRPHLSRPFRGERPAQGPATNFGSARGRKRRSRQVKAVAPPPSAGLPGGSHRPGGAVEASRPGFQGPRPMITSSITWPRSHAHQDGNSGVARWRVIQKAAVVARLRTRRSRPWRFQRRSQRPLRGSCRRQIERPPGAAWCCQLGLNPPPAGSRGWRASQRPGGNLEPLGSQHGEAVAPIDQAATKPARRHFHTPPLPLPGFGHRRLTTSSRGAIGAWGSPPATLGPPEPLRLVDSRTTAPRARAGTQPLQGKQPFIQQLTTPQRQGKHGGSER